MSNQDLCRICGNPSMVMNAGKDKEGPFRKVPFGKNRDARSFICGLCVADGALRLVEDPEESHFDLRVWRKAKRLTQVDLAKVLEVDRSMVAKVEIGEKSVPVSWGPFLAKM